MNLGVRQVEERINGIIGPAGNVVADQVVIAVLTHRVSTVVLDKVGRRSSQKFELEFYLLSTVVGQAGFEPVGYSTIIQQSRSRVPYAPLRFPMPAKPTQ